MYYELRCYNAHSSITSRFDKNQFDLMKLQAELYKRNFEMKYEYTILTDADKVLAV